MNPWKPRSYPGRVHSHVDWNFKAPVRPEEEITGTVEVTKVRTDKPMTEIKTTVTRDDGTVVPDGEAMCYTSHCRTAAHSFTGRGSVKEPQLNPARLPRCVVQFNLRLIWSSYSTNTCLLPRRESHFSLSLSA